MLVTEHTSDDPQFPCGDYKTEVFCTTEVFVTQRMWSTIKIQLKGNQIPTTQASYNECHLREASSALQSSIGCVPHWFHTPGDPANQNQNELQFSGSSQTCGRLFYPSPGTAQELADLLERFWHGGETSQCPKPCRTVEYESRFTNFNPNTQWGIGLVFEDAVMVTRSVYQVDKWTLMARVGGLVGLGRNIYWILTTFLLAGLSSISMALVRLASGDKGEIDAVWFDETLRFNQQWAPALTI